MLRRKSGHFSIVTVGALIMAVNLNTFVHTAGLLPGGFTGESCYKRAERKMLYTVVSSDEEDKLVRSIKKTDPKAFVNILQTKMLKGNFIMKKQD